MKTRQERRDQRKENEKRRIPKHGKSFAEFYQRAIDKRRGKEQKKWYREEEE